jgi:NADH-quinone oxidoreductase subunit L
LAAAGALTAWFLYIKRPELPALIQARLAPLHALLVNKYYFDWVNEKVLAPLTRGIGRALWHVGDRILIDGLVVNGSAKTVAVVAGVVRRVQSGYLYHYAFAMVIGVAALIGWFVLRSG